MKADYHACFERPLELQHARLVGVRLGLGHLDFVSRLLHLSYQLLARRRDLVGVCEWATVMGTTSFIISA
jgi:hypothetical protein